jgi:hypothetical protein
MGRFLGISLHITSMKEGTVSRAVQYLHGEAVTGTLSVSFGRHIPDALIFIKVGAVVAAEFGDLIGLSVFDLLLCQEYAIKEITFQPGRAVDKNDSLHSSYPHALFAAVEKPVKQCGARPLIYGLLEVRLPKTEETPSLLHILFSSEKHRSLFEQVQPTPLDREAALPQCKLLRRAFDNNLISYKNPLVALKKLKPLLDLVQPLEEKEAENLGAYLKSLLPHPSATHMPLERFYAYGSAVESIAYRRGPECGDECRKVLYQIVVDAGGDKGAGSAPVPAGRGPKPKPLSAETKPKPRIEEDDIDSD